MASKGLGIPQTKGTFQISGNVLGVTGNNFFKETTTKTNKPFRSLTFGVQVNKEQIIYVTLSGMEQEKVYFSKIEKGVTDTIAVPWADRNKFSREGYRLIGVNCGVEKIIDANGKEVNSKRYLTPFDACKYISEHLKDGMSVFVKGVLEYSHFTKDDNTVRSLKLVPNQISLCKNVEFDKDDFKPTADFKQVVLFMDIRPPEDGKYWVETKIVNYNSIEEAEFGIADVNLAKLFKKNLKAYTALEVWGEIQVVRNSEEVEVEEDGWGAKDPTKRVNTPYKREMVITGASPKSIDTESYSEKVIEKAMEALNSDAKAKSEFGESDWGSKDAKTTTEEDSAWD